ncbi:MAG: hypothetical protein WCI04_07565, partial [archaeon]
ITLEASAVGYAKKTVTLGQLENEKEIILETEIKKGTIIFTADSPIGKQSGAQINVINDLGFSQILTTLYGGEITQEFDEGDYNFSAYAKGYLVQGNFKVEPDNTKYVVINFNDLISDTNQTLRKKIQFKAVDINTTITSASARIYIQKGADLNFYYAFPQRTDGQFGPLTISDTNAVYTAVIRAQGYVTAIADLNILGSADTSQLIHLTQGGAVLSITVVDDINSLVKGAAVNLFIDGFNVEFETPKQTDLKGAVSFTGLPNGKYTAAAKTTIEEGSTRIDVNDAAVSATIKIIMGSGKLKLFFYSEDGAAKTTFTIQKRIGDSFVDDFDGNGTEFAITKDYLSGTELRVIVNDPEYMPY